ncbi:hypothetical protein, partial [Neomegalonema sp.]|uniref:hypothetical protein n=1 Tax=Neomegalonema sp. TaxID=2039713 RepID=UPI002604E51C
MTGLTFPPALVVRDDALVDKGKLRTLLEELNARLSLLVDGAAPLRYATEAALLADLAPAEGMLAQALDTGRHFVRAGTGAPWSSVPDRLAAEVANRIEALSSEASARAAGDAALATELTGKLSAPAPGEILDVPAGALGPNGRVVAAARSSDGRTPERIYA